MPSKIPTTPITITINTLLNQMGTFLQECPKLIWEWSLSGRAGKISDQNRVTCWVAADEAKLETFTGIYQLLDAVNAPVDVLQQQQTMTPTSIRQGVSVALLDNQVEWRLYLHNREPGCGTAQYQSYRWTHANDYQTDTYQFHFFPKTPERGSPLELVHPLFTSAMQELIQHERLKKMSGFWLRSRADQVLQVDLAYPWHPKLAEFAPTLQALSATLGISPDWLHTYEEHPIRHIAISGQAKEPAFTIYFSAPTDGHWPLTLDDLKNKVFKQGKIISTSLEHNLFTRIPPETTGQNTSVGKFYDTNRLDLWRQVLGPKMHYHFGMFDTLETASLDDVAIDAGFDRAVSDLYPFISKGDRIYDIGCGWGGPALQLLKDLDCQIEGITVSWTQFCYCSQQNLQVRHGDVETTLPAGYFDCMLLMESLSHVRDKLRLLKVLRLFGKKLVLRGHCQDFSPASTNFGGTMHMQSSSELRELVEQAGWNIVHWRNRRQESMPSIDIWHRRLQSIPPSDDVHLETLRNFCRRVLSFADEWAASNPLIELVAQ